MGSVYQNPNRGKCDELDPNERKSALEKLWDAWERLKTIEAGADKKASVTVLLDQAASGPELRKTIESGFSLAAFTETQPYKEWAVLDGLLELLRKAGLPD